MTEICAIVPVYEHGRSVGRVIDALRRNNLCCFIVDDGSGEECAAILDTMAADDPGIHVLRHAANRGKGAAVQSGLRAAVRRGYTHALQIDADGQHALADIPRFLTESRASPESVVCGLPVFGTDLPRSRRYGRRLTNFWVCINTWSHEIPDSMCGFRVYPLAVAVPLLERSPLGSRMDFDIAILVRLHWLGVEMRWLPTSVSYPAGGVSHFRMSLDNALIARAHALLFAGMLARAPILLARKLGFARSRYSEAQP